MIRFTPNISLVTGFALCALAAVGQADEPSAVRPAKDNAAAQQYTASSNAVTTVVRPPSSSAASPLSDLQQRKQQSIQELNKRAEDLVHQWKLRKVRQAIADIKAQEEKDARIAAAAAEAAAAAAEAAAKEQEALRNQAKAPTVPQVVEPVLRPTPAQTADVVQPPDSNTPAAPSQQMPPQEFPEDTPQPDQADPALAETAPTQATAAEPENADAAVEPTVEGPVDRVALASSLFATGSFNECLSILKAVDQKEISTENRDWCDFLAAGCYRKLNDLPEAESRYRSLLGRTEVSWLANATRWWLDHLNEQQKLRGDLQQLQSKFTAWQGEIDAFRDAN